MFDKTPNKSSISQNNPLPPSPLCSATPPLSPLFRALFRGGLILFDSLVVILSSVNLSFWSGITLQNIKGTLILKMCQSSVLCRNAPFPSLLFHFFGHLRKLRGWAKGFLASHLLIGLHAGVDIAGQRAQSLCIEATQGHGCSVTTSFKKQRGLGGTNYCSMGVEGQMKPH